MFTDRVLLKLRAGRGGDGLVAWRREKYIPKGGPYGGDGAYGGSVIIEGDCQLYSLESLSHRTLMSAEDGGKGRPNLCRGKTGADLIIKVPCGTLVRDAETGTILYDLTQDKERFVLCQGGRGGFGNAHFRSPSHRSPYEWTEGVAGEEKSVKLELKLIADVGLIGFPNAGKSTLLSSIAGINLKTGAYPFTTLTPAVAPLPIDWEKRLIIADIPGIVEGAHQNKGLGLEFLRHIERTRILLFVIDISGSEGREPEEDFRILLSELHAYNPELLNKPRLIALNKIDEEGAKERASSFIKQFSNDQTSCYEISALLGEGMQPLVTHLKSSYSALN